jgi:lysophosphatidate acyltransferase
MMSAILRPVGIASAAILSALGLASRKSRRARFAYHLTLYAGTLGIMSVWGVVVSVAATLIGQVCIIS